MSKEPEFTGELRLKLLLALGRAEITPFSASDWSMWAGAEGFAHMVKFTEEDLFDLCEELNVLHWLDQSDEADHRCVVILDEQGITFNGWLEDTGFVGQVNIGLNLVTWEDYPDEDEMRRIRDQEIEKLWVLHRAYLAGRPITKEERGTFPVGRQDMIDYYGKVLDEKPKEPGWLTRARYIQNGLQDPIYDN